MPTTPKKIKCLLSLIGYYRKFSCADDKERDSGFIYKIETFNYAGFYSQISELLTTIYFNIADGCNFALDAVLSRTTIQYVSFSSTIRPLKRISGNENTKDGKLN